MSESEEHSVDCLVPGLHDDVVIAGQLALERAGFDRHPKFRGRTVAVILTADWYRVLRETVRGDMSPVTKSELDELDMAEFLPFREIVYEDATVIVSRDSHGVEVRITGRDELAPIVP